MFCGRGGAAVQPVSQFVPDATSAVVHINWTRSAPQVPHVMEDKRHLKNSRAIRQNNFRNSAGWLFPAASEMCIGGSGAALTWIRISLCELPVPTRDARPRVDPAPPQAADIPDPGS